jgi:alpha-L-arabinofuranosidase
MMKLMRGARKYDHQRTCRPIRGGPALLAAAVLLFAPAGKAQVKNGGFEAATPNESWQVDPEEAKQSYTIRADTKDFMEGRQSLLVSAEKPVALTLRQELFLPVGTLWRLTGWVKADVSAPLLAEVATGERVEARPRIGMDSPGGSQGSSEEPSSPNQWQRVNLLFRVPSPGRMTIALRVFNHQSGKVWLDDIQLQQQKESAAPEIASIGDERIGRRPIDIKQGGQFIEPLCSVLPSLIAQQVASTSFEEETPWRYSYRRAIDQPYRPWYPDGSVHVAAYSYDTGHPFNGLRSQRIDLPVANTWAGISQDGFYFEAGRTYRLRMHLRSRGTATVRAWLHGEGGAVAGSVSLGNGSSDWTAAEALFTAKRTIHNATLTIEFKGPGTLWIDRVYLIDKDAVLGIWRPDVVQAMKKMNAGIVRFGGSIIEVFDWDKMIGNWDDRAPIPDEAWGGIEENFVGPEEIVKLVQSVGYEPLICLRWTGKTPQDAANEVEYFNGSTDTRWGSVRAKNGHPEPYHVKYWEVGNEVGGAEYDASLDAFTDAMRKIDPTIRISTSYPSANTVRLAGRGIDYLSPHHYSVADLNGTEDDLKTLRDEIARDGNGKDIRISVTEWNASGGDWGLTRGMLQTLGNALICSRYQNMLHRYSDIVEIANLSNFSTSFAGGQLQTGPGWIYKIPTYYTQGFYQRSAGSYTLKIARTSQLPFYLQEPDLDATITPDGKTLRIYAINSTPDRHKVNFRLTSTLGSVTGGQAFVVSDSAVVADSEASNSKDNPERISPKERSVNLSGNNFEYEFAPFTITLVELQLRGK